jgi:hypothetical protein
MKTQDIIDFYWSVPINLLNLAEYFPKAKTKKDLEYIVSMLEETARNILSGINQIEDE